MLISGLPQIVREGDNFRAGFTVRNATDRKMNLRVNLSTDIKNGGRYKNVSLKNIQPGQSGEAGWDIKVPQGVSLIEYIISATEEGGSAADRMKISQKVLPAVPVRTVQALLTRLAPSTDMDLKMPRDAVIGKSLVKIDVKPSITAGLSGVRQYMSQYPYSCLEQNVSKAIALQDKTVWDGIMKKLPSYMDRDYLLKYFPCSSCEGSDVLSSYVLSSAYDSGYAIPGYLKEQLVTGLKAFAEGRVTKKGPVLTSDLTIR
jgi:alpha-2-macroglobulin